MNDNQQKFADMVQQNKSTIYTVCYMFSKDQDEVNDLFQEVLIRLWQGFANFEGRSDVKTWIYRVRSTRASRWTERNDATTRKGSTWAMTSSAATNVTHSRQRCCTSVLFGFSLSIVPLFCSGSRTSATRRLVPSSALRQRT